MEADARSFRKVKDGSKHGQFFIYYSGHGCINDYNTAGVDIKGDLIELDYDYAEEIGCNANTTLICFFDCCRSKQISTKNKNICQGRIAQHIVYYTCKPG